MSGPPGGEGPAQVDPRRIEGQRDPVEDIADVLYIADPRSKPDPRFRTTLIDDVPYYLIRWKPTSEVLLQEKTFQITGDHVYCESLHGGGAVYIKLGPHSNPWLRLRPGMTYRRRFGTVRLFATDEFGFVGGLPSAVLYVSMGPLFVGDRIKEGISNSILAASTDRGDGGGPLTATTTPQSFLGPIYGQLYIDAGDVPSIGAVGGAVVIKNTDPTNTLMIGGSSNVSVGANAGFPLEPGETFQATISDRLSTGEEPIVRVVPMVWCEVGTCTYAFFCSPYEKDGFQDNASRSGGIN